MGKSTLLENMIVSDIRAGNGLAVIDPHGDLVEKVLDFIPQSRIEDVIYFNPADTGHPIAFNVLEAVSAVHRPLVASGLVSVFKKIWADSWGPRLEYVLRNAILALLECPGNTLLSLPRLLTDEFFREKIICNITDPVVKSFWETEYERYPKVFRTETISPIQNKVGQFLSSFLVRNILGQPINKFDLREVLDSNQILLVNLSKGKIGEDNSSLLGALLITTIFLAALSRADVPEKKRSFFALYVDEFQDFATESFANILSESRKYNLGIAISNQFLEQLDEKVRSAVFGNVGTIITFRVGSEDVPILAQEFFPTFDEKDLISLPKYHIYLKLSVDGVSSEPFSAVTLPPPNRKANLKEKVVEFSRKKYCTPKETVEKQINEWINQTKQTEVSKTKKLFDN